MAGSLRGIDSSGIAVIDTDTNIILSTKLPVSGPMFIGEKYANQLIKRASQTNTITIAHVRSATSGRIGLSEAHPFEVAYEGDDRTMIGVHNGTLTGWNSRAGAKDYDVDSEWGLNKIFLKGAAAFAEIPGSYCFVWYDSADPKVLNIALNDQRPMFISMNEDGGMAYASEAGMLAWLCERNRIVRKGPILSLLPDSWYKFDVTKLAEYTRYIIAKPVHIPPAYTPPAAATTTYLTSVDKTDAMLKKIADSAAAQPAPTAPPNPLTLVSNQPAPTVGKTDVENAKDLNLLGKRGEFIPEWFNITTQELCGTYVHADTTEYDAIICNAAKLEESEWNNADWTVSCIGVRDDGRDLTVVCSRPFVGLRKRIAAAIKPSATAPQILTPTSVH